MFCQTLLRCRNLSDPSRDSSVWAAELIRWIYWRKVIVADREDQTAVRVSGGVIYGDMRVCLDVCECVWMSASVCVASQCTRPLITFSLQSQGGFMGPARRSVVRQLGVQVHPQTYTSPLWSLLPHSYITGSLTASQTSNRFN